MALPSFRYLFNTIPAIQSRCSEMRLRLFLMSFSFGRFRCFVHWKSLSLRKHDLPFLICNPNFRAHSTFLLFSVYNAPIILTNPRQRRQKCNSIIAETDSTQLDSNTRDSYGRAFSCKCHPEGSFS